MLEQSQTGMGAPEGSKSWNGPDVITCVLLGVGTSFLVFNSHLGPLGYPVAMLAYISGLGYSILRVHRSTRHPELDRKRSAVTGLVVNALLVMVLGAAVPVYFLGASADSKPFKWREHVSVRGHYTIQLPDDAEEVQRQVQTATGPLTLRSVTVNMGRRGEYISGYYDLSDRPVNASDDEFLDFVLQYTASQGKRKLLGKKPIFVSSPNGLEVKALEAELQLDVRNTSILRLYWVRERSIMYVNLAEFERATTNSLDAEKFLDSFQLVAQ